MGLLARLIGGSKKKRAKVGKKVKKTGTAFGDRAPQTLQGRGAVSSRKRSVKARPAGIKKQAAFSGNSDGATKRARTVLSAWLKE